MTFVHEYSQSTVYGMAFALLLLVVRRFKVIDDSKHEALFTRAVSALVVLLGAAAGLAVSDTHKQFRKPAP